MKEINTITLKALHDFYLEGCDTPIFFKDFLYLMDKDSLNIDENGVPTAHIYSTTGQYIITNSITIFKTHTPQFRQKINVHDTEWNRAHGIELKKVKFPVTWECVGTVELEVPKEYTNDEIYAYFNEIINKIPVPEGEYLTGTFRSDYNGHNIIEVEEGE